MIPPKTCLLFIIINLFCVVTAQDMDKRVPQGFLGMRGKKYLDSEETGEFYKRKPQFFVGVKGKKNYADPDVYDKRARMGFFGMRGKKEYPELMFPETYPQRAGSLFGQIEYAANELPINQEPLDDLITDYIQKLQGSNLSPEHIDTDVIPNDFDMPNEVDKRANLHQFYGVRGKKSIQNKRPYDLSFRGKFIGVRGKKDVKNNAQEIKFLLGENGPWPKRKAQMGFFGMRGKKWTDESSQEETPY